jgi:2-oxoisovalerate dehydrogenase E1 component alpha subunit
VCENNHFAISVPTSKQMAVRSVADRAVGYGMAGVSVDGTNPLAVYRVVCQAVERARAGEGPTLIEANVARLTPHSSDDDDRRYRTESDRQEARHHDPLLFFAAYLRERGLLDDAQDAAAQQRVQASVSQALERALAAADPSPESAFDHVYADARARELRAGWARA